MIRLTIDGKNVEVEPGRTVLDAARLLGIDIPTLCHLDGCQPNTTCMTCVVRIDGRNGVWPSCATAVEEGMVVESESEAVRNARRTALELLLSDHAGDCVSPCQNSCPAHMDISQMIRQIGDGELHAAIETVKADIPLPAVLGRICQAPCEPGCRRAAAGGPVAICHLKRYVADIDLATDEPYLPPKTDSIGKRVAIVGAGPSGLSSAYFLQIVGCECTVFDRHKMPGGALRYEIEPERLPHDVLDGEIDIVRRLGATFRMGTTMGDDITLDELRRDYDAVIIATGGVDPDILTSMGLAASKTGLRINPATFETNIDGVFAAGGAVRPSKLAIRSVAEGKAVAACVTQHLTGQPIQPPDLGFNTRLGKLDLDQLDTWLAHASRDDRTKTGQGEAAGFTAEEALAEAMRCLHCECGAQTDCRLREAANEYGANSKRFGGDIGRPVTLRVEHPHVIYEPGKCIACGLCVQIAAREKEALGLAFVGRGFNVRVEAPFSGNLNGALKETASACCAACPTGALVNRPEQTPAAADYN